MKKKNVVKIFFIFFIILILLFGIYKLKFKDDDKINQKITISEDKEEESKYSSNIIENVRYASKDAKGNEYIIEALEGEIDYSMPNTIYLKNVKALIKLIDSNNINVSSSFGKYNLNNYDTIFSKNVKIDYLDNKITGEYLDFSLDRNSMIISKKVIYTNLENILKADVVELNINTKDTKIFMFENNQTVNIKSNN